MMKIDNFFAELKRRNVYEVAITYAVSGMAVRACFFTGAAPNTFAAICGGSERNFG